MTEPKLLLFLKLGGSLITDKQQTASPRLDRMTRLAKEVRAALDAHPNLRILLGHGSGSFGHVPAKTYQTRNGVQTPTEWRGFAEVWAQAKSLNHLVTKAFVDADLHPVSFSASSAAHCSGGKILHWDPSPIQTCLQKGLLPVVYGDVAFDSQIGGTVLSTEDIFVYFAKLLRPQRILLAGLEDGIFSDYPTNSQSISKITLKSLSQYTSSLSGSGAVDVTGGMASKVELMLALIQEIPELEVSIFSGVESHALEQVIAGQARGTRLSYA